MLSFKLRPLRGRALNLTRAFSNEVDTGSLKKMRPNKKLERRSDSIGSKSALGFRSAIEPFVLSEGPEKTVLFQLAYCNASREMGQTE